MTTKWFAYRFMSPLTATTLFTKCYVEAYQAYIHRNYDKNLAPHTQGVRQHRPLDGDREYTLLWRARQRADEHCLPYPSYLEFCFHFAARRIRNAPPRPNQLHGGPEAKVAWEHEFRKFIDMRGSFDLQAMPLMDQYRGEMFEGLPAQKGFRDYVVADGSKSLTPWAETIGSWSIQHQVLPASEYRRCLPEEDFLEVIKEVRRDERGFIGRRLHWVKGPPDSLWQACFGVPGAQDLSGPLCSACPQSEQCSKMSKLVLHESVKHNGSEDPKGDTKRASQRLRTAKSRRKKKSNPEGSERPAM